jgi:hypothetical protein
VHARAVGYHFCIIGFSSRQIQRQGGFPAMMSLMFAVAFGGRVG